ncbi:uncharacterized protein G2W53_028982 [Senna tora]|uniref:RNase H type-1 domain-containing protein n=1 Tax=Senna tora TaxID=362788 RepID=A0A834WBC3_9FABA|nr:uncharacterized protein G2W53_028982 [Senna tora]
MLAKQCWRLIQNEESLIFKVLKARLTVEKIMCIPLHYTHLPDRWAWKCEASGKFSMKSGYKLAMWESWEHMNLTHDMSCDIPTAFWKSIWKLPILSRFKEARNQKKFANEPVNLNGLWAKVERQWDKLCVANSGVHLDVEVPSGLRWEKPRVPFIKLNVDATIRSTCEGALGGVFRDAKGLVHGVFMASTPILHNSTMLEALAIKKGVEVAHQLGIKDLIVESDSRIVIDMLNSNCNHSSLLCSICITILDNCTGFNDVYFQWTPRACNQCADSICKAARNIIGEQIW